MYSSRWKGEEDPYRPSNKDNYISNHYFTSNKYHQRKKQSKNLFQEDIRDFEGVELIFNEKISNVGGLELLLAIKNINKYLDPKEHTLLTLVDEYYDENDFKDFCNSISNNNFSIMAAIKEFNFPDEYLKNYAVIIDREKQIITKSIEKGKKIVSDFFGTGLI